MILFFAGTVVLLSVLQRLPAAGWIFRGFFGFWIAAILLSVTAERVARALLARRAFQRSLRDLGHVESAYNQGKLGSLLLSSGKAAAALPHLQRAVEGEPSVPEWRYRLGQAQLATRRFADALDSLERAVALNSEHAYGDVQLALVRAQLELRRTDEALASLARYEREFGPNPESAYHRGLALRLEGKRAAAKAAFREVGELAARTPRFQRKAQRPWVLKAWLARLA
jgi:hypothetical protein